MIKNILKKKKKKDKSTAKDRLFIVSVVICGFFAYLILKIGYLTIIKGPSLSIEAQEQWRTEISVSAKRGDILDRNGTTIVTSANVYRIDFDLNAFRQEVENEDLDVKEIASNLAQALEISVDEVMEIIESKTEDNKPASFATLARGVEKAKADKIRDLKVYGVMISDDVKRFYPHGNFLAHTLGSINSEGQGLTGIELQYDKYLSGISGMKIQGQDSHSNKMAFVPYKFTPPIDGKDVELTIDANLQYFAEIVAQEGLEKNKAKKVSITIMDPNNGEILAMVNKPDYDPNNPYDGSENFSGETEAEKLQAMWRNSLINDTFEPGSTFKTITMIAAMEEGLVHENETFNCTGGVKFGSHTVKCWQTWGHGVQTLPEILKNSCNVGFMELGARLGKEKLNEYIKKLGFGRITGIDLPGEAEGIIKSNESISEIDLATISFGQTNTVTGVQLMAAFNTIANGGDWIQPHVVKKISHKDKDGKKIIDETFNPKIKKDILSESNTAVLRGYLERTATQDGPAGSFVQGYNVGGKTGTAQKVDPVLGGYSSDKFIASMVALAPVDNPKITVFISVDEPSTGQYYGGQVAAPLMKELFKHIFSYMDSPHGQKTYTIAKDIVIPNIRGMSVKEAIKILDENSLGYEIEGNGENVISMDPYPGTTVEEGSVIKLSTKGNNIDKRIMVPDLKGRSVEFAGKLLEQLGLNYSFIGEGDVYHQSIPSGSLIEMGTTIELTLKKESEY